MVTVLPKQSMYGSIFPYMKTIKINHSWIGKYTRPYVDGMGIWERPKVAVAVSIVCHIMNHLDLHAYILSIAVSGSLKLVVGSI